MSITRTIVLVLAGISVALCVPGCEPKVMSPISGAEVTGPELIAEAQREEKRVAREFADKADAAENAEDHLDEERRLDQAAAVQPGQRGQGARCREGHRRVGRERGREAVGSHEGDIAGERERARRMKGRTY